MKNIFISKIFLFSLIFIITSASISHVAIARDESYVGTYKKKEWYISVLRSDGPSKIYFSLGTKEKEFSRTPLAFDCLKKAYFISGDDEFTPIAKQGNPKLILDLYNDLCDGSKVSQKGLVKYAEVVLDYKIINSNSIQTKPDTRVIVSDQPTRQTFMFPAITEKFSKMTELQQKQFNIGAVNQFLNGKGEVKNIEKCGLFSESKLHKNNCIEIVLENGKSRAVLYVDEKQADKLISINKGSTITISNCYIVNVRDWRFFTTVYCDLLGYSN